MSQTTTIKPLKVAARKSQNDSVKSLWDLVQNLKNSQLVLAPHQREFVWDRIKIKGWGKTLIDAVAADNTTRPTGFMVTYQLPGVDTVFLNDGLQRLMSTILFLNDPRPYGITADAAKEVVQAFDMPIQHRLYNSHEQAMVAFQLLNYSTPLTNYEFCAGFLGDLENSSTNWKPFLTEVHDFLNDHFSKNSTSRANSRDAKHLKIRHNYLLLYLFLSRTHDFSFNVDRITVKQVSLTSAEKGRNIEQVLRSTLENTGVERAYDLLAAFKRFIQDRTASITDALAKFTTNTPDRRISEMLLRYLLSVNIIATNAGISNEQFGLFLFKMLPYTSGGTLTITIIRSETDIQRYTINIGTISRFASLCALIGSDLAEVIGKNNNTKLTTKAKKA